jgi:hypothetical protein
VLAIEVRPASTVEDRNTKHLHWLAAHLRDRLLDAIVINTGLPHIVGRTAWASCPSASWHPERSQPASGDRGRTVQIAAYAEALPSSVRPTVTDAAGCATRGRSCRTKCSIRDEVVAPARVDLSPPRHPRALVSSA